MAAPRTTPPQSTGNGSTPLASPYEGVALLADPIHGYIVFTVPTGNRSERTEKEIIDSPWVQRLRRIHQLQSSWWVYPSGEHSRFQHVLGTMHMAGAFARHLYPTLKETFGKTLPSEPFIEELLRLTGLLHDVGHGPFGHFFDDHFLQQFHVGGARLNHEILGMAILTKKLGRIIKAIRRSPSGPFQSNERLDPGQIAFLIKKPETGPSTGLRTGPVVGFPDWLLALRPLFSGIYTVDNLDYVQRDAYMTGFSLDMVDIERLLLYTFFTPKGLTLHKAGESALMRFLNAKFALYAHVYHHRTTRAIDLHVQEIFKETMARIAPYNPYKALDRYLELTDWFLLERVREWATSKDPHERALGAEWGKILGRKVKWKMAYDFVSTIEESQRMVQFQTAAHLEEAIRRHLSTRLHGIEFKVDMAALDPRPINPLAEGSKQIFMYNPATGEVSPRPLMDLFRDIPPKVARYRVFTTDRRYVKALSEASEKALTGAAGESVPTNI
ncbi:MAG: HD domain-containing protein [candidate division NC10 bacterium]|nr:HD domain-containing protein [candidate division NC10 bacterium]MDE2322676.1 HD domain-containing protein [candidate division NC10 bacterium]